MSQDAPDDLAKKLPPVMAEVHALVGTAGMLALVEHYGGTRLHVPAKVHAGSELAQILKITPAKRLVKHYGGDTLSVALCKEWRVHVLRAQGHTLTQIARRLGMAEFSVWRILNRAAGDREARPAKARRNAVEGQLTLLIE